MLAETSTAIQASWQIPGLGICLLVVPLCLAILASISKRRPRVRLVELLGTGKPLSDSCGSRRSRWGALIGMIRASWPNKWKLSSEAKPGVTETVPAQLSGDMHTAHLLNIWEHMWFGNHDDLAVTPFASAPRSLDDPLLNFTLGGGSMLQRPKECPFCGKVPEPDYVSNEVPGAKIYTCPFCEQIVWHAPSDKTRHLQVKALEPSPKSKPFAHPPKPKVDHSCSLFESVKFDSQGFVVGLFDGIVDRPC